MQQELNSLVPVSPQAPSGGPSTQERVAYDALVASIREESGRRVSEELAYLNAQVRAGELTSDSDDYRRRLDTIDVMRRGSHVRRTWVYSRSDDPAHSRTQDYILEIDIAGNVWADWKEPLRTGVLVTGQPQPSGRRMYARNPDAASDNVQN